MSTEKIEIVQNEIAPFSYEISQNSKGYVQLKVKVRSFEPVKDEKSIQDLRDQFSEAFAIMKDEAIDTGFKIQPDNDPIDQKKWSVVITDLEQHEAEDTAEYLKQWSEQEDTPPIDNCIEVIPPKKGAKK